MPLQKLEDFDRHYRETFGEDDLNLGRDVYAGTNEKIGTIGDVLVNEVGHFRYLVVDMGFWVFGKRALVPIGRVQHDHNARRLYVSLTKAQVEALPDFNGDTAAVDDNYEEQVRRVYRTPTAGAAVSPQTGAGEAVMTGTIAAGPVRATSKRDTESYQQQPSLYELNDRDHQTIKLYQERLLASKTRKKTEQNW